MHCVVFGGFSPDSLASRIEDSQAKMVITADSGMRGGKAIPLKANVDEALKIAGTESVEHVIVVHRTGNPVEMQQGRDLWYHMEIMTVNEICPPEPMNAEDPLFILYTSGSTGKPKGVLHTTGGYLTYVNCTFREVLTSNRMMCSGVLPMSAGLPGIPMCCMVRFLMVQPRSCLRVPQYQTGHVPDISSTNNAILYTAPTAIRAMMRGCLCAGK